MKKVFVQLESGNVSTAFFFKCLPAQLTNISTPPKSCSIVKSGILSKKVISNEMK